MLVARAYFLKRAQCAWARAGACTSFSGDHGMMPPVSLPVTPGWTPINHASMPVTMGTVRMVFMAAPPEVTKAGNLLGHSREEKWLDFRSPFDYVEGRAGLRGHHV